MKKFAIISISIVLLVAVVCVAAFAFWDTTEGNVNFTGSNIGSAIKLTTVNAASTGAEGAGKNLVSQDAVLGKNDAKLVCLSAVNIKIESNYTLAELQSLIKSLKYTVTKFTVADNTDIKLDNYANTFDLFLTTDIKGVNNKKLVNTDFHTDVQDKYLTGYTMYAFLQYKSGIDVDGAKFATKTISIDIQFEIA